MYLTLKNLFFFKILLQNTIFFFFFKFEKMRVGKFFQWLQLSLINRATSKIVKYVFADFFLTGLRETEAFEYDGQKRTF